MNEKIYQEKSFNGDKRLLNQNLPHGANIDGDISLMLELPENDRFFKKKKKLLEDLGSHGKHVSIHSSASPGELESSLLLMLQRARIINLDEIYSILHHNSYEGVDGKKSSLLVQTSHLKSRKMGESETVGIYGWKGRILSVHSPSMLEYYYGFVRFYSWRRRVMDDVLIANELLDTRQKQKKR